MKNPRPETLQLVASHCVGWLHSDHFGQGCMLQSSYSMFLPSPQLPEHCRLRECLPPPHFFVHVDQLCHSCHSWVHSAKLQSSLLMSVSFFVSALSEQPFGRLSKFSQVRFRIFLPLPQVTEQAPNSPHWAHCGHGLSLLHGVIQLAWMLSFSLLATRFN